MIEQTARKSWTEAGRRGFVGIAMAGTVAVAGCSGSSASKQTPTPDKSVQSPQPTVIIPTVPSTAGLTFDALGGGSSIIAVYDGPANTPGDKRVTGTYNSGDTVNAECKTVGRQISSVPSNGETPRTSRDWIKLALPGDPEYASAVYVRDPAKLLGQLATCQPGAN